MNKLYTCIGILTLYIQLFKFFIQKVILNKLTYKLTVKLDISLIINQEIKTNLKKLQAFSLKKLQSTFKTAL